MKIVTASQYARAKSLLATWLNGRNEVGLSEAARALSNADVKAPGERLGNLITPRMAAGILKAFKYRKSGTKGTGYDREPLYALIGSTTSDD